MSTKHSTGMQIDHRALWGAILGMALLLGLAGCSASPASRDSTTGVVTGTAQACAGPSYVATADLEVYRGDAAVARNEMYEHVVPVAKRQVPTESTYRFVLPAGHYFITNTGNTGIAHPFVISEGSTIHLDVPNLCI